MIPQDKTQIRNLKFEILFPAICEALNELYTLSGKFQDVEKIKIFATALTKDLPTRYPYLTTDQLRTIFSNAIMGEFGELKTIALPDIYKWLRKWQETAGSGQVCVSLASPDTQPGDIVNWSHECHKAYNRFLNFGLNVGDFSHLMYLRLQIDNFIVIEGYRKHIQRAADMLGFEPDFMDVRQRELAQKFTILEVFENLKKRNIEAIYKAHSNAI